MKHLIKVALAAFVFSVVLSEPEPEPEDFDRGRRAADHFAEPEPEPEDFNRGRRSAHDFESLGALDDLNILLTQCKRFESMRDDITEYLGKAKEMIAGSSQSADTVENQKIKLEAIKLFLQGLREAKSEDDLFGDTLEIFESEVTDGEEDDDSYLKGVASISDGLESLSEFDELNSLLAQCKRFESMHNDIMQYLAKEVNMIPSSTESSEGEDNQTINLDAIKLFVQGLEEAKSDHDLIEDALNMFESEVLNGEADDDHDYVENEITTFDDPSSGSSGKQEFLTDEDAIAEAKPEKHEH
jgi:hypothetical protein